VTIGSSARAFDAVDSGEAELGLSYAKPDSPKVTVLAQAELPVGAVFRSDHPLAKSKSLNVRELMDAGLPLLLADRSIEIRQMMEHAIGKDALRLLPRLDTNSVMVMSQLAKTGAGMAVKTRIGIEQELARGELVFVPLRELAAAKQRLLLFFRQDTRLTPTAAALAESLTAMVLALDS
jgi:DNA-binding transcriptional LysR family regulator